MVFILIKRWNDILDVLDSTKYVVKINFTYYVFFLMWTVEDFMLTCDSTGSIRICKNLWPFRDWQRFGKHGWEPALFCRDGNRLKSRKGFIQEHGFRFFHCQQQKAILITSKKRSYLGVTELRAALTNQSRDGGRGKRDLSAISSTCCWLRFPALLLCSALGRRRANLQERDCDRARLHHVGRQGPVIGYHKKSIARVGAICS